MAAKAYAFVQIDHGKYPVPDPAFGTVLFEKPLYQQY
jgi:uncharacterized protein (DUF111 family)